MKYANLQQARRLVEGFSPKERDLILPLLPTLPEQKTFDEILEDVYEAYMDEGDEANSDRLAEIHFQLENWIKITPARETAFFVEDAGQVPGNAVVFGRGVAVLNTGTLSYGALGATGVRAGMVVGPRALMRVGWKNVEHLGVRWSDGASCRSAHRAIRRD